MSDNRDDFGQGSDYTKYIVGAIIGAAAVSSAQKRREETEKIPREQRRGMNKYDDLMDYVRRGKFPPTKVGRFICGLLLQSLAIPIILIGPFVILGLLVYIYQLFAGR